MARCSRGMRWRLSWLGKFSREGDRKRIFPLKGSDWPRVLAPAPFLLNFNIKLKINLEICFLEEMNSYRFIDDKTYFFLLSHRIQSGSFFFS